jgi:hypothetical protein
MNKCINIGIVILVLCAFVGIDVVTSAELATNQTGITKLSITPQYDNVRLQPGESKEITVTVKNGEDTPITVQPNITSVPYDTYVIDTNWIKITPTNVEIPAGESVKFTINVSIPKDATVGSSNVQIAFTDEMTSVPYPQPMPYPQTSYAHAFQLFIEVWKPPNLQVAIPYISDQLEAGKSYDYDVDVKNVGNYAIGIDPILVNDQYYIYGMFAPILAENSITITAPESIPAGAIETIKIHADIPTDVMGYYNGYIDLRSNDPSLQQGEGRIAINLNIWKQPTEPFVKTFTLGNLAPIILEISSYYNNYPYMANQREKPYFDTNITGPGGNANLNITKTVIRGNVNMWSDTPSWDIGNISPYQEIGGQYITTYKTDGSPGEWKINILPHNTQGFDYSITIGDDK